MKVIGRTIYKGNEITGRIVGNRPHVNDIYKGAKCDFAIIWTDGIREDVSCFAYFRDVVRYIKNL